MKNIFFDFDGTIIDTRYRIYYLFIELSKLEISFEEYWKLKSTFSTNKNLLEKNYKLNARQIEVFHHNWMTMIETPKYLAFNTLFDYSLETLSILKESGFQLYLVTNRQSDQELIVELKKFCILKFFQDILITRQKCAKADIIKEYNIKLSEQDYMIGDTGEDILAGKALGIKTVAVLSGVKSRDILYNYQPNYLCDNIYSFKKEILDDKIS